MAGRRCSCWIFEIRKELVQCQLSRRSLWIIGSWMIDAGVGVFRSSGLFSFWTQSFVFPRIFLGLVALQGPQEGTFLLLYILAIVIVVVAGVTETTVGIIFLYSRRTYKQLFPRSTTTTRLFDSGTNCHGPETYPTRDQEEFLSSGHEVDAPSFRRDRNNVLVGERNR